ncbi:hypothetical protein HMPREF0454_01240 [Hafnia alvei ATCC 51873]|uniref:Uncharacterized protein n=1 Tax=Hafnia alvei ATCC 51873 TaxID=1002364 RepID=G9Y3V9_HAFAL|nr:hypothetical protein HMPREF0454_01240 [Hafnia alvei ATCC 51873]
MHNISSYNGVVSVHNFIGEISPHSRYFTHNADELRVTLVDWERE